MKISLADKAGFCFGVTRAVKETLNAQKKYNKKIYTLGPLIHNNDVVNYLKDNNIYPISIDEISTLKSEDVVVIRSHGVSLQIINTLKEKELNIINATCPYVSSIHHKVKKYHNLGYNILIIGDKNHPEVIGINGWCNNKAIISKDGSDLQTLPNKICVVSQTTEKHENWRKILNVVIEKCKEFIAFNTICNATEIRQKAAKKLSEKVDLMIVLGGKHSSNTTKLYEICKNNCINTIHAENSGEIPDNLINLNTIKNIGVTAGASTPEWVIKEAILKMNEDTNLQMNEQLEYMEKNDLKIVVGKNIKGEVIQLDMDENTALIDIKDKKEAILPIKEVSKDPKAKINDILTTGEQIETKIIKRRNENGQVVLSILEIERQKEYEKREKTYKELKEIMDKNETLNITITKVVKGGLVSNYNGARIFIPASHIELFHVNNLEEYVGKEIAIKIIEFSGNKKFKRIIGSRKKILKIEKEKMEQKIWDSLEKDTIVEGDVKRLTDFGAFIDINGIDGLLHISEISWGRVEKTSDALKIGEKIKVYILNVDKENKKLSLSIKKLTENPWNNVDVKYPVGNVVLGKVVRFASFGAFVELEPGIDALVHISEISNKRVNKPEDVLTIGEQIKTKIIDVNKEDKKIGLSIKEVDEYNN